MPEIGRIQSTNFQSLLTDLGITRNNIPFALRSEVTPVVLVGGTVSFIAAPTPAYGVTDFFTAGALVTPVAGAIFADTGPLPIGAYSLTVWINGGEANAYDFEWRNAANSANLRNHRFVTGGIENIIFQVRYDLQNDNERFRITLVANATAGFTYQGTILAKV